LVEEFPGKLKNVDFVWQTDPCEQAFESFRNEDGFDDQTRAEGLVQQGWAFDARQARSIASRPSRRAGEHAAKLFQASILLAMYNADRHPERTQASLTRFYSVC
jgi:hypothetical protein